MSLTSPIWAGKKKTGATKSSKAARSNALCHEVAAEHPRRLPWKARMQGLDSALPIPCSNTGVNRSVSVALRGADLKALAAKIPAKPVTE